ncbi:hypothetical protein NIES970_12620 [[Synechococcus] sp. NIES-970]|uniref:hypothetical protein n=1 Tax=Picosynechococcus sp. NKBG15041c TaxID=1407650 RepID=UPI0004230A31|nr:hypothetical protein [Picosynechococcus sp. NKBG15041c]BAW96336.1 hypothetical protein NIES970_12620 [[Synechococcus] sp. NIES-970]
MIANSTDSPSLSSQQIIIAQVGYVEDPDVLGQIRDGFQNFVDSGQLWAMILGFVLGYWFSGLRRG